MQDNTTHSSQQNAHFSYLSRLLIPAGFHVGCIPAGDPPPFDLRNGDIQPKPNEEVGDSWDLCHHTPTVVCLITLDTHARVGTEICAYPRISVDR